MVLLILLRGCIIDTLTRTITPFDTPEATHANVYRAELKDTKASIIQQNPIFCALATDLKLDSTHRSVLLWELNTFMTELLLNDFMIPNSQPPTDGMEVPTISHVDFVLHTCVGRGCALKQHYKQIRLKSTLTNTSAMKCSQCKPFEAALNKVQKIETYM